VEIEINVLSNSDLAERAIPPLLTRRQEKITRYADEACVKRFEKCRVDDVLNDSKGTRCPVKNVKTVDDTGRA